jgi:hypothetical protein
MRVAIAIDGLLPYLLYFLNFAKLSELLLINFRDSVSI